MLAYMKKTLGFFELHCYYDLNKKVKVNVTIYYWPLLETKYCSRWEPPTSAAAVVFMYLRRISKKCFIHHDTQKKPLVLLSPLIFPTSSEICTKQECNPILPLFCQPFLNVSERYTLRVLAPYWKRDIYNLWQRKLLTHLSQWNYIIVHKTPIKLLI